MACRYETHHRLCDLGPYDHLRRMYRLCTWHFAQCKDDIMAGRTKGVRHTCPEPLKGRGEARYFAPKGTQGKGGVGKKSKAEGLSAGDSLGSDQSARPEVRGVQDEGNESGIR